MSIISKWYGFGVNPTYDRGIREFTRGNYEAAANDFRLSLTEVVDPEIREAARNRLVESLSLTADGELRAGRHGAALLLLQEAIKLRPQYADLRLRLAEALLLEGRAAEAREEANRALEINPYFIRAILVRAAGWAEEDPEAARTLLMIAEDTEPNLPADDMRRIRDHLKAGRGRAAAASLLEMRVTPTMDAKSLAEIGMEMARQGKWVEAEHSLALAVQAEPKWADLRCRHAEALLECGRLVEAYDEFSAAIDINSSYADALALRGIVNRRMGNEDLAQEDFRRAIKVNPNHTVAVQELSRPSY